MNNIKQEIKDKYMLSDNTIDYLLQIFKEVTIMYRLDSLQNLLDRPINDTDVMNYIYKETVKRHDDEADKTNLTASNNQSSVQSQQSAINPNVTDNANMNPSLNQNQSIPQQPNLYQQPHQQSNQQPPYSQQPPTLDPTIMRIEETDEEKVEKIFSKTEKVFKTIFLYILLLLAVSVVSTLLSVNLKYTISMTVLSILIYKFLMLISSSNYKSVPISRDKYAGHREV